MLQGKSTFSIINNALEYKWCTWKFMQGLNNFSQTIIIHFLLLLFLVCVCLSVLVFFSFYFFFYIDSQNISVWHMSIMKICPSNDRKIFIAVKRKKQTKCYQQIFDCLYHIFFLLCSLYVLTKFKRYSEKKTLIKIYLLFSVLFIW